MQRQSHLRKVLSLRTRMWNVGHHVYLNHGWCCTRYEQLIGLLLLLKKRLLSWSKDFAATVTTSGDTPTSNHWRRGNSSSSSCESLPNTRCLIRHNITYVSIETVCRLSASYFLFLRSKLFITHGVTRQDTKNSKS